MVLATLCEIAAVPAHQARVTALAPIDNVAGYVGLGGLVQGIAQTSGPIVGSCLIELTSPSVGWILLALLGRGGGGRLPAAADPCRPERALRLPTSSTVEPVVRRASSARWASAAAGQRKALVDPDLDRARADHGEQILGGGQQLGPGGGVGEEDRAG